MDDFYSFLYENEDRKTAQQPYQAAPVQQPISTQPRKEKKHSGVGLVALALSCSLLGGAVGAGAVALSMPAQQQAAQVQEAVSASALLSRRESGGLELVQIDGGKELTAAEVYAQNVNSTVGITTEIQTTNYWGYQTTAAAAGSGFIITEDGYILTNYHVVENASTIHVDLYDGTAYAARLVGYDAGSDVAVLKVDANGLTPVVLGDSDELNVGDTVMAIGNPLGELTFSLTTGTVSALGRDITMSSGSTMRLIQTDTAINSGNSGGALFNSYGEVVGITNAKYSSSGYSGEASIDNIAFAIPINSVLHIVSDLMETGHYAHPYIGVSVQDVQDTALPKGAEIAQLQENSPAERAGLRENDIITAVNGEAVNGSSDLVACISASTVGERLTLEVYRDGETIQLTLTVGEKPDATQTEQQTQTQEQTLPWGFGIGR